MSPNIPLLVIDRRLVPPESPHLNELWARGDVDQIENAVTDAFGSGVDSPIILAESVAADVEATNDFLPLFWMLAFLRWLGLAAGLVALWAVLLHLEAQERARQVSSALVRRMGLTDAERRATLLLEIGTLVGVASIVGMAMAWGAARLVSGTLDPLPMLPPPGLFRVPWAVVVVTSVVMVAMYWIIARVVQRGSDRTDVGSVMRDA
jgi:hypothetical protein